MRNNFETERLLLDGLGLKHAAFIAVLVNTPGWLEFIGDRNVRTPEQALTYIQNILNKPTVHYWVVTLKEHRIPIGIITFIKRDYLEHYDIGFAFLPEYTGKGFAREATMAVLKDVVSNPAHTQILATTVKRNKKSILLLESLGLRFAFETTQGNDALLVYAVSVDKWLINQVTNLFFSAFTNANQQVAALENIYRICLPQTIIIKKEMEKEEIYTIHSFIAPRKKILTDGTLTEFEEYEVAEETTVVGYMAHRLSTYQKTGYLNGEYFEGTGNKLFQYIKTSEGWKIASVVWEDKNA